MNAVSLKCLGDWQKQVATPLRDVLAVSMDICGRTGQEACKHAIILMAQSAAALTKQSPKRRPVERDPEHHNAEYVNVFHKGKESRFYRWNYLRDDNINIKGTWEQAQKIANRGLAKRSWIWGLKGLDAKFSTGKPIPGVVKTMAILGEKACGYILENALSYLLKILPAGWESTVAQKAGNKIMKQAAMKIERRWKSEMSRSRRGGMAIGASLSRFFKVATLITLTSVPILSSALDPAKITCTNYRGEAVSSASADTFYWGDTIHWTNCVVMSGTTNETTRQDLTGLTILLTWGNDIISSTSVTGNITTATSGVWNASTKLRSSEGKTTFFELRITNSSASFTYPFKTITTRGRK